MSDPSPDTDSSVGRLPNSLAFAGQWWERLLGITILLCLYAWALGVSEPLMTVEKLWVFEDTYSVLAIMETLRREGDMLLYALVGLFAVANPLFKMGGLLVVWAWFDVTGKRIVTAFSAVEIVSKWSMADVFVVAMLVVIAKTSGFLADARVEPGLSWFAGSAVGSMAAAQVLKIAVHRKRSG